jgi:non-heme chloroperoxidase
MRFTKVILVLACLMSGTLVAQEAKVTELLSKDLTNLPGKEGLMITVEYPPGSSDPIHRHNVAVPPILVKSATNPEGLPIEVFDGLRSGLAKDRSQFYKDFAAMFYGANRPDAKVSQGMLDQFWLWSMQAGLKNSYDSIKAFSETDFTEDLKKFDVPTLVMHGEDDQVVPIKDSAKKSARLIKGAQEIYYPGRPHGLTATHQDEVNTDLLKFLRSVQQARKAA